MAYPTETKSAVIRLAKLGVSYPEIQKQFPVPKSTISLWLKNAGKVPDRSRQLKHLERIRKMSSETKRRQRLERIELASNLAEKEACGLPLSRVDVMKSLLAMLYWAEGGKQDGNMKFTNTDPELVLLYLTLLRNAFPVDEGRLRVALHVHHYHNQQDVLRFWSHHLTIPESQFWKIYVKKRSEDKEYRRNFKGICHVHYSSSAMQRELLALGKIIAQKVKK